MQIKVIKEKDFIEFSFPFSICLEKGNVSTSLAFWRYHISLNFIREKIDYSESRKILDGEWDKFYIHAWKYRDLWFILPTISLYILIQDKPYFYSFTIFFLKYAFYFGFYSPADNNFVIWNGDREVIVSEFKIKKYFEKLKTKFMGGK